MLHSLQSLALEVHLLLLAGLRQNFIVMLLEASTSAASLLVASRLKIPLGAVGLLNLPMLIQCIAGS